MLLAVLHLEAWAGEGMLSTCQPGCRTLTFTQSSSPGVNTTYLPFTLLGRLIAVEARVDSVQGFFLLDTGADRLLLNAKYFSHPEDAALASAIGMTGLIGKAYKHSVDSIFLEQLAIGHLAAHIVDLEPLEQKRNSRIAGILGRNVFEHFSLFIDFQNQLIRLDRLDKAGNPVDAVPRTRIASDSLSFAMVKHLIILRGEVNQTRLRFALDTGAELNLLDRRVKRRVLDHFEILKRVNLIGANGKAVEVLAGTLSDVYCGGQHFPKMNTLLTNLDEFNIRYGTNLHGVLGYEFFESRRVLINYHKKKLFFYDPVRP